MQILDQMLYVLSPEASREFGPVNVLHAALVQFAEA